MKSKFLMAATAMLIAASAIAGNGSKNDGKSQTTQACCKACNGHCKCDKSCCTAGKCDKGTCAPGACSSGSCHK